MENLQLFMKNNIEYIIAVVALFISLITLFSIIGVNFNSHRHTHIDKIVTVEAFINEISEDSTVNFDDNEEQSEEPLLDNVEQSNKIGPTNDVEHSDNITQTANTDDTDDTGDVPLMDDSEETGNPIRVSFSKKQKKKEEHKAYKQRRIMQLLKEKHNTFQKTLDQDHLSSHCHPVHTTAKSAEDHCNTMHSIEDKCKIHPCCVWLAKDKSCVAGNINGPTFLKKDGQYVDNSHYYHKGQCFGTDC